MHTETLARDRTSQKTNTHSKLGIEWPTLGLIIVVHLGLAADHLAVSRIITMDRAAHQAHSSSHSILLCSMKPCTAIQPESVT